MSAANLRASARVLMGRGMTEETAKEIALEIQNAHDDVVRYERMDGSGVCQYCGAKMGSLAYCQRTLALGERFPCVEGSRMLESIRRDGAKSSTFGRKKR